jgi:hypothetical protein
VGHVHRRGRGAARRGLGLVVLAAVVGGAGVADAGRGAFGWVRATEVVPERGVEIETWLWEENDVADGGDDVDRTLLWWAPVVGITDRLELALPVELRHEQPAGGGDAGSTQLYAFGAEARWRLTSPDPVEASLLVPLVRLGASRLVATDARVRGNAGVVLGAQLGCRGYAAAGVDTTWHVGEGDPEVTIEPSAGVMFRLVGELMVGAEAHAELGQEDDWAAIGPTVAWTHGRFWAAATLPVGLAGIDTAPRINWGVAF